ncbi:hypothetical protein E2C01_063996 [Portunus trituberculatus]|uniref:Uncharacterized protein n=1 Tax=Portunus trituberculatus TaxID=210409 RepID=A0A5B7HJP1_PORTR|nr:hypothetical protein [Portunus trituberculatus]
MKSPDNNQNKYENVVVLKGRVNRSLFRNTLLSHHEYFTRPQI